MVFKVYSAVEVSERRFNVTNYKVSLLKVNKTFEDLQILQELNKAWAEVGPRIKNYMETSLEIQMLQV